MLDYKIIGMLAGYIRHSCSNGIDSATKTHLEGEGGHLSWVFTYERTALLHSLHSLAPQPTQPCSSAEPSLAPSASAEHSRA